MTTLLYVEASPRKQRSHSIRVADAFLGAWQAANPDGTLDRLDLWSTELPRFDGAMLNAKYAFMHGDNPSAEELEAWQDVQAVFQRFDAADKYVFSVPMWNFGVPYVLKHYIDVITQPGLAWSFSPDTGYAGLVSGKVATIYSSGGAYHEGSGFEAFDLQKPYLENWLAFIGLTDVQRIVIAGTLGDADALDEAAAAAEQDAAALGARF